MAHYLEVPYLSGTGTAQSELAALAADARTTNKRIAIIGDSQEDTVGDSIGTTLSFFAWQHLGKCNESCIFPLDSYGSTDGSSLYWLAAGQIIDAKTTVVTSSYIPPGRVVKGSGTTNVLPTSRNLLAYLADSNPLQAAGDYTIMDITSGCVADLFVYSNSAGPPELKWQSGPVDTGPSAGSFYPTMNATGYSSGLVLDGSSNVAKRFRTGTLPYDAAKPYTQLFYTGSDGASTIEEDAQLAGARLIGLADSGGLVWEPFAVSGYKTIDVAANHANAGPMFALMGGTSGWSAIAIGLMNNDAIALGSTAEEYKSDLIDLIALLRTWTGEQTLVILLGDPPTTGSGWTAGTWDKFNSYADVQRQIANEVTGVVAINSQRLMYDAGYDPTNATYSADGIHPTALGTNLRAKVITDQIFALGSASSSELTTSAIVAAINADATQAAARAAAIAAASQTAAATLRTAVGLESANLSHLVNAVVGKQNVTDNGNGTYDIAIRNAADSATLVTIRYNPTTGVKTVV